MNLDVQIKKKYIVQIYNFYFLEDQFRPIFIGLFLDIKKFVMHLH